MNEVARCQLSKGSVSGHSEVRGVEEACSRPSGQRLGYQLQRKKKDMNGANLISRIIVPLPCMNCTCLPQVVLPIQFGLAVKLWSVTVGKCDYAYA